jgi:hypothetical protein
MALFGLYKKVRHRSIDIPTDQEPNVPRPVSTHFQGFELNVFGDSIRRSTNDTGHMRTVSGIIVTRTVIDKILQARGASLKFRMLNQNSGIEYIDIHPSTRVF